MFSKIIRILNINNATYSISAIKIYCIYNLIVDEEQKYFKTHRISF